MALIEAQRKFMSSVERLSECMGKEALVNRFFA